MKTKIASYTLDKLPPLTKARRAKVQALADQRHPAARDAERGEIGQVASWLFDRACSTRPSLLGYRKTSCHCPPARLKAGLVGRPLSSDLTASGVSDEASK